MWHLLTALDHLFHLNTAFPLLGGKTLKISFCTQGDYYSNPEHHYFLRTSYLTDWHCYCFPPSGHQLSFSRPHLSAEDVTTRNIIPEPRLALYLTSHLFRRNPFTWWQYGAPHADWSFLYCLRQRDADRLQHHMSSFLQPCKPRLSRQAQTKFARVRR